MEAVPASAQDQLKGAGWNVESKPGYGNPFLMFNTQKAPFDKPEVRRAILKSIDKKKLISSALEGQAVEATSFLPEANPAYKKPATDLSYDKDAASKLLSDAGVSGLEVNLVSTDHPWVLSLVPQIKSDLEALGLKVNHTQMASSDLYSNVTDVDNPTYDIVLAPATPRSSAPTPASSSPGGTATTSGPRSVTVGRPRTPSPSTSCSRSWTRPFSLTATPPRPSGAKLRICSPRRP